MATAAFQPYIEKENVESFQKSRLDSTSRHRGKVFQANTKPMETTRRALGNVNIDPALRKPSDSVKKPGLKPLGLKPVQSLPQKKPVQKKPNLQNSSQLLQQKKPLSSKSGNKQISAQPIRRNKLKSTESTKSQPFKIHEDTEQFEEIEKMFMTVQNDDDDDYEDIWPKKERPSSYIGQFLSWRPPCLFGRPESDSEEEPEVMPPPPEVPDISRLNPLELRFEEENCFEELHSIRDIEPVDLPSFPELDDSIPLTLNDSLDISFKNGALELKS